MAYHYDTAEEVSSLRGLAPVLRRARLANLSVPAVAIEIADAQRFAGLEAAWSDLASRAAEPNAFMDPAFVTAAAAGAGSATAPVLLAWQDRRLVGAWALRRMHPRSGLPISILGAPTHSLSFNSTPVIDRDLVDAVLGAMIAAIQESRLPNLLGIEQMNDGGPIMGAIERLATTGRHPLVFLRRGTRPKLVCNVDPATYATHAMSSGRRRKLGQLRRKLAARGALDLRVHHKAAEVSAALGRFMALEASGWKGKFGSALRAAETPRRFSDAAIGALAVHGRVEIWELTLDQAPVSMAVLLRSGNTVFDWRIAYDERHGDCSPGVLIALDYTDALLRDPTVAFADSCAFDDSGLLGRLWTDRQGVANFMLDVTPGGSRRFAVWAGAERGYRLARQAARGPFHAARRLLRHLMRGHDEKPGG